MIVIVCVRIEYRSHVQLLARWFGSLNKSVREKNISIEVGAGNKYKAADNVSAFALNGLSLISFLKRTGFYNSMTF